MDACTLVFRLNPSSCKASTSCRRELPPHRLIHGFNGPCVRGELASPRYVPTFLHPGVPHQLAIVPGRWFVREKRACGDRGEKNVGMSTVVLAKPLQLAWWYGSKTIPAGQNAAILKIDKAVLKSGLSYPSVISAVPLQSTVDQTGFPLLKSPI